MNERILVLDNDTTFIKGIKYSLEQDGFRVEHVRTGEAALSLIQKKQPDMLITELELTDISGMTLCQNIRSFSSIPIIFSTIVSEDVKKILAFEYGADDYIVKPYNVLELKARIKAIFRRSLNRVVEQSVDTIEIRDLKITTIGRSVSRNDKNIALTGKEFDLIYVLASNPGEVFTREQLLERVWGYAYYGDLRTVDVHIRRIREKIELEEKNNDYIVTKWGVGYYFKQK